MANIGFGLDTAENFSETGYDQYAVGIGKTLSTVAEDTWKFNPLSSLARLYELESTRIESKDDPVVSRDILNNQYKELDLVFEEDQPQSVVDIIVQRKIEERKRRDIISRGPEGILPGIAKFAVGLGVSVLDPINIGAAFIPVVGEARFASLLARTGSFTAARGITGAVEGAIGTAIVEPIIYTAAQREKADYGLMDSFLNVTFGTIFGGGLHVGAGKLKDLKTIRDFRKKVREARENLGIDSTEEPEINLYKLYYPENSDIMMKLEKTDPQTREALLAKAIGDIVSEQPVEVRQVAQLDPELRNSDEIITEPLTANKVSRSSDQMDLDNVEANTRDIEINYKNLDSENQVIQRQLEEQKSKQEILQIKDSDELISSQKEIDELNTKEKEIQDAIIDGINCINGR